MNELDDRQEQLERLVDLVRLDYDATLRTMQGFVQTAGQIRAAGVAAWGVVLGFALRDESWELALLATALVLIFAYADAYHSALYRRSFSRVIRLESLLDAFLDQLGIDAGDEDAESRLLARLETHRFGMNRSLGDLTVRNLVDARPYVVFRAIYPALFAASCVLILLYAL
jgi:hypothetical protein